MKHLVSICVMVITITFCKAQVDISSLGFNYSALVRDTAGRVQPLKPVTLRFTILQGQTGTAANSPWVETQNLTTDAYGFANTTIGTGTKAGGSAANFKAVDFTNTNYWLLIEVYNTFTKAYDALAKQGLQAVPYAKVAYTSITGGIPAGTIVAFGGPVAKIPAGWELCDGSIRSASDPRYINLYNAIGTAWGAPESGQFRLPYTLGMFLRGQANGSGWEPDRGNRVSVYPGGNVGDNVGSFQRDAFGSHNHSAKFNDGFIIPFRTSGMGIQANNGTQVQFLDIRDLKLNIGNSGGSETRPVNVFVNYIIKL